MKITNKDICMFTGGAVIGGTICGVAVIYKFIKSKTFGPVIIDALAEKMVNAVVGESRRTSYRKPRRYVSYKRYTDYGYKSAPEFDTEFIFETRGKAEEFIDFLTNQIDTYDNVTVADAREYLNLTTSCEASLYGWRDKSKVKVEITRTREGYSVKLPKPYRIVE